MHYFSSRNQKVLVNAEQAIVSNLCPQGGLYMPEHIPLNRSILSEQNLSLAEIGSRVAVSFLSDCFTDVDLKRAAENSFNFPAPIVPLSNSLSVLELTHGPSLAFKDFGARFMAECLSLIANKNGQTFKVLTATSGDTGGAVAAALHGKEGISVCILYPEGRISAYQEYQMTKWGDNVSTISVQGSFDDCQDIVKSAFQNQALVKRHNLVSANSINISRLLAQMVYYIHAMRAWKQGESATFVVPSGNLGNLTAGIFATRYAGANVSFVAAHNKNSSFVDYLHKGIYDARRSEVTVSNAMDVGAPSNFERLSCLFEGNLEKMREVISGTVVSDQETLEEMKQIFDQYSYLACPHTAVGFRAAKGVPGKSVVLATAHPIKFSEVLMAAKIPNSFGNGVQHRLPPTHSILASTEELVKIL